MQFLNQAGSTALINYQNVGIARFQCSRGGLRLSWIGNYHHTLRNFFQLFQVNTDRPLINLWCYNAAILIDKTRKNVTNRMLLQILLLSLTEVP